MRIMFISSTNLTLGIAMRCEADGHDVRYVADSSSGQGLVKTPNQGEKWIPNIAVYDHNQHSTEADSARAEGFKVLGPSRWSSLLETDDTYRRQIISSLGWPTDPLASGTHFYISAWFNGACFIASYASIIYRRFMPGGAGSDLYCTGMVSDFRPLTKKTHDTFLAPLEKMLKKVNHRGCVHIHAMVNESSYSVKEIYASFAHPHNFVLYENTNITTSDILLRLFDETSKPIPTISPWACGIQVSLPPFPHATMSSEVELRGIVPQNLKHLWLADVSYKDKYLAQSRGLIGYVTARGSDEQECIRRMYRTVGNLKVPDLQYRNDVGRSIQSLLQSLRQPGWLS